MGGDVAGGFDYEYCFIVSGERDVKRVLLLIKNEDDRERWLGQLSRITLSREDPAQRPPSPM